MNQNYAESLKIWQSDNETGIPCQLAIFVQYHTSAEGGPDPKTEARIQEFHKSAQFVCLAPC